MLGPYEPCNSILEHRTAGYGVGTYNHLLVLLAEDLALDDLDVLQAGEDLVLDLEADLHAEGSALLDCKGLLGQGIDGSGVLQIDDNVVAALDLEAEGEDDALAGVVGVGEVLARSQAERLFPLAKGLVILVCRASVSSCTQKWAGRGEPSCVYSSMVFFWPTLKPAVCSGASSSSGCELLAMFAGIS